jgi:hypothetical protein
MTNERVMLANDNRVKWISLLILGGALAVVSLLVLSRPTAREKYTAAYPRINYGDAKQMVIDAMGKPDEIRDCSSFWHSEAIDDIKSKCGEQYFYRGGLEQWLIVLDREGKVISKSHNISY